MKRMSGIVFGLVLVMGATACGDDDQDGASAQLTKTEFVTQVNAACKPFQDKTMELFETGFPTSEAKLKPFFEKLTPNVEGQLDAIKEVDPPKGEEAAVAEIVTAGEATVADFKKAIGDPATAKNLFSEEGGENAQAFEEKAKAFGLSDCVEEEDEEDEPTLLDPSTFSPEKQAYVAKADAICKAAEEKISVVEDETFETFPPPLEKWATFLPAIVETYGPALQQLKALSLPAGDEATLSKLYADLESQLDRFGEAAELAKAGKQDEFDEAIQPVFAESDDTEARQRAYGFQVCGSEGDDEDDDGGGGEEGEGE
ncbi:MAG: hypothetical protein ABIW46_08605 [Acidimicrobiales bacterium]